MPIARAAPCPMPMIDPRSQQGKKSAPLWKPLLSRFWRSKPARRSNWLHENQGSTVYRAKQTSSNPARPTPGSYFNAKLTAVGLAQGCGSGLLRFG